MVEAMKTYLNFLYAKDISVKELAVKAEMPEAYMVEVFRKATGVTPGEYQALMRLGKARALLVRGVSAVDVATRTGFGEVEALDAAFRRLYGVSLSAYLESF